MALVLTLGAGPALAQDLGENQPAFLGAFDLTEPSALAAAGEPGSPSARDWVALGDWSGLGRDTALLVGWQLVGIGFYYVMPEGVSKWDQSEKDNVGFERYWDNFTHPQWDPDEWYVNAGHAYFGAAYYIRARDRGFGEVPSFVYSTFASLLYEFGIECFFEKPSYQDIIITPVGGTILGAFVFEPVRNWVKAKAELKWYDHALLVATDPLGGLNYMVERLFGIKSEIRVDARPPNVALSPPASLGISEPVGVPKSAREPGISVEMRMRW
jgi:hypothetical protein